MVGMGVWLVGMGVWLVDLGVCVVWVWGCAVGGEGLIGKFGCLRGGHKESHSTQSQLHRHGVTDGMHCILTNLLFDVRT